MEVKNDNTKLEYSGRMSDYQLHNQNKKPYVNYEQDSFNSYQNHLYKRALFGLSTFEKSELEAMCNKKKMRIAKVHKKAQRIINIYKQKLTIAYTNDIFSTLFPNSPVTEFLLEETETDNSLKNSLTFKELGITKEKIAKILISEGVLPKNFMSIRKDPNALPRLNYGKKEKTM